MDIIFTKKEGTKMIKDNIIIANSFSNELLELIKNNPELKVLTFVQTSDLSDYEYDHATVMVEFGSPTIREYISYNEQIYFKDEHDLFEYIFDINCPITEEQAEKIVENMEWTTAIFVQLNHKEKGDK